MALPLAPHGGDAHAAPPSRSSSDRIFCRSIRMIEPVLELRHAADVVRVDVHDLLRRGLDAGDRYLQDLRGRRRPAGRSADPAASPPRCARAARSRPRRGPSFRLRSTTGMMRPRRLITPLMNSGRARHVGDLGDADDLLHERARRRPYSSPARKKVARCSIASTALRSSRRGRREERDVVARAPRPSGSRLRRRRQVAREPTASRGVPDRRGVGAGAGCRRRGPEAGSASRAGRARAPPRPAAHERPRGTSADTSAARSRATRSLALGAPFRDRLRLVGRRLGRPRARRCGSSGPSRRHRLSAAPSAGAAIRPSDLRSGRGGRRHDRLVDRGRARGPSPPGGPGWPGGSGRAGCRREASCSTRERASSKRSAASPPPPSADAARRPRCRRRSSGRQVELRADALGEGAVGAVAEALAQLGLADEHDRDQVAVVELEVREQPDLLEGGACPG